MQTILRQLRISKGLSQQQLANCLKISMETISSLEDGLFSKIAAFYNITTEVLFTGFELTNEQVKILKLYNTMDDISKGKLLERASYLSEESSKQTGLSGWWGMLLTWSL